MPNYSTRVYEDSWFLLCFVYNIFELKITKARIKGRQKVTRWNIFRKSHLHLSSVICINICVKYISANAIRCQTPVRAQPGIVDVTLSFKGKQYCKPNPGRFVYTQASDTNIEYLFMRLSKAVPRYATDPHGALPKVCKIIDYKGALCYFLNDILYYIG